MIIYLDSSALVKLYVREPGSDRVRFLLNQADSSASSAIAYAEIRAALARRHREGAISLEALTHAKSALLSDWQRIFVVPVLPSIAISAGETAEQYALRGMDAVHLATAFWLQTEQDEPVTLAAWDMRLVEAAATAGLSVEGPDTREQ
jgi:predicted nucleic acid-binding protein